ncbi:piggyBac transposable element-derived protein 4-like [Aphis craccivora]|uniref:PiggyBac transposable element-derived protein 4-like n=1 Tax=Aphis craccivora TaxID=307492 RepID=A0A6G0Y1F9_APHCR|nr:piggyBac transposable element-derived protein 4-like [Aphis craccivora]
MEPMFEKIVDESNLYATQHNANLNTNVEEIIAFIGILIFMGFHSLPSIRLYWSTDQNFFYERVAKIMPVKIFLKILRYLHLNNNLNMPQRDSPHFDKHYKIRPLISHLQDKYQSIFKPSRHVAVDESMVPFKGRSTMKQYMPNKSIKRGFKIWALADSASGFLLNFDVYTGKKTDGKEEFGLGENVVLNLCENLKKLYYCVYFDNFFTSIPMISKLLEYRIFACGIFRTNKKFYPKNLMKKDNKYASGDIKYGQCNDISVMHWKDRGSKPVTLISNIHNAAEYCVVLRRNSKGEKVPVSCPTGISDYNKYMGGVDKFDQYMAAYTISQKSCRWWIKLFYYFIDTAIVNSYILYKESCNKAKKYMFHS